MTLHLPRYLRRLIAAGLAVSLPVALLAFLVFPLWERYAEVTDAVERSVLLLARYKSNSAQKAALTVQATAARQTMSQYRGFVEGANQPLASSNLQSSLRRILESNGGTVRVISVAPPVKEFGYDKLTARAEISVSADRLIAVLHAVEASSAPGMIIDAFDLRAADTGGLAQQTEKNLIVTARLDVSGYWGGR